MLHLQDGILSSVEGGNRKEQESHTLRHAHHSPVLDSPTRQIQAGRGHDWKTGSAPPPPPFVEGVGQREQLQDVMRRLQKLEELGHAKILSLFSVGRP